MGYAEFATSTNFSFLRGASPARDLVLTALLLGHRGIGIADRIRRRRCACLQRA